MVTESSSDMPSAAVGSGRFGMRSISLRMRSVISPRAPSSVACSAFSWAWRAIGIEVSSPFCLASAMALAAALFAGPCLLHGGLQSPALTVQLQECVDQVAGAAARQRFADAVWLRADQLRVDHDLADTNASRKRATPSCSGPGTVASASSSRI